MTLLKVELNEWVERFGVFLFHKREINHCHHAELITSCVSVSPDSRYFIVCSEKLLLLPNEGEGRGKPTSHQLGAEHLAPSSSLASVANEVAQ